MLYRNFSTQEELDAQYNLQNSVPDFGHHVNFFVTESQKARERLACQLSIPCGPTLAERVDVFPAGRNAPILVFIHGGYWYRFSSKDFSFVAEGPVSSGVTTILIDYALCPAVTLDEIVRQSRAAVAWVYSNAEDIGGDRERIFVSGHSAGGHLATMVSLTDWEGDYGLPPDIVKGAFPISGLYDLRPFPYTYLQPKLQLTWGEVLRNSPILNLPDEAPSMMAVVGGEETPELLRQSEDFLAAWQAKGLDGDLLSLPKKNHYDVLIGFLKSDNLLCSAIFEQMNV